MPRHGASTPQSADDAGLVMPYAGRMLPDLIAALALSFPIPVADVGCPGYYYDPCDTVEFWSTLTPYNAQQIPSDGVLVLQGARHGSWDDAAIASVELTVTLDDVPVAGALELSPLPGLLVWRPEAAWVPGSTYKLSGSVTNVNPPDGTICADATVPIASDVVITAEPAAPLGKPGLSGMPTVTLEPTISLATLACCEGASPTVDVSGCNGTYVNFDPAMCAPISGIGHLAVEFTGTPAAAGPAAQQIVYTQRIAGSPAITALEPSFSFLADAPFCAALEALDLASGAITTSASLCFGDMVVDQLGPQALAIPETLTCSLQQCQELEGTWNTDDCEPLDPDSGSGSGSDSDTAGEDGDKGCGCNSSDDRPGGAALLGLVGLLGLARRRRSRSR
jgi:MYXO-CTERM domain-containing protein